MRKKSLPKKERQARLELAENAFLLCAACPHAVRLVIPKKMPTLAVRCKKSRKPLSFAQANGCKIHPRLKRFPDDT